MTQFEPFDSEYVVDKTVLSDQLEDYLLPSIERWLHSLLLNHSLLRSGRAGLDLANEEFLHPIQETFRRQFPQQEANFILTLFSDVKLFRNILSYILQNIATVKEARDLETVLERCSSAYAVEFIHGKELKMIRGTKGEPIFEITGTKLVFRVPRIVSGQAKDAFSTEPLLGEAWEAFYGMMPDDEKVVTRATDALAGAIRDNFFPNEKRPVFGTMLNTLKQDLTQYPLPASTIYNQKQFLETMDQFSKIRGNHQKGTGRKPTHEEAGFVLHFAIMFYQILRSKNG